MPWEVRLVQDPNTGMIEQEISVNVSATFKHGYPTIDGGVTFFPTAADLADNPVPVLVIAVIYAGEIDETKVLKEIVTEEDWAWLEQTYGVRKEHLGLA